MAEETQRNSTDADRFTRIRVAGPVLYGLAFGGTRWLWELFKREWPVLLVSVAIFASGLLNIIQVLLVRVFAVPELFSLILPLGLYQWSRSLTLASGFILIYLSAHIFQRKKVAWWFAACILAIAIMAHVLRGNLWYVSVAPAITLTLLLVFRPRFTVRSEFRSVSLGLILMAASVLIAIAYGTFGFWLLNERDFGINFHMGDSLVRTLRAYSLIGNDDLIPTTRQGRWFLHSLGAMGVVGGVFALYSLFRPLAYQLATLPHEREIVRGILELNGGSTLDYFKLWPDKSYFFSELQTSCVSYKVSWSVALCLGDPVGPDEELEPIARSFANYCFDNDWSVAFHQVVPELIPMYRRLGFDILKIGEEGIVDLEKFCTDTVEDRDFRRVRRRFEQGGFSYQEYQPPHASELLNEIHQVSTEWLSLPGRRERTFTLGRFDRHYLNQTPIFVVRDPEHGILAFVNEIPTYREGNATIDLMRHRLEIPNGTMDYLFQSLLMILREEGFKTFSLGLAPFAGVGDEPGASLEEQAISQIFERLNRFFSYKGLYAYKEKFEPEWEDRFLVYQGGPPGLIRTAVALTRATEG